MELLHPGSSETFPPRFVCCVLFLELHGNQTAERHLQAPRGKGPLVRFFCTLRLRLQLQAKRAAFPPVPCAQSQQARPRPSSSPTHSQLRRPPPSGEGKNVSFDLQLHLWANLEETEPGGRSGGGWRRENPVWELGKDRQISDGR